MLINGKRKNACMRPPAPAAVATYVARGRGGLLVLARLNEHSNAKTEKLYCQYYNKRTGKSLVAFEYLSAPAR